MLSRDSSQKECFFTSLTLSRLVRGRGDTTLTSYRNNISQTPTFLKVSREREGNPVTGNRNRIRHTLNSFRCLAGGVNTPLSVVLEIIFGIPLVPSVVSFKGEKATLCLVLV